MALYGLIRRASDLGIFKIFEEDYALDFGNVFGNEDEIVNDLSQLSDVGREIILKHYGVKRKSGRYPWDPSLHLPKNYKFIEDRDEMKKRGLSDNEIAKQMGLSTTVYRSKVTIAKEELKQYNMQRISKLQSEGMIIDDIAKTIGTTGQTVRNYLDEIKNPNKSARAQRVQTEAVAQTLEDAVKRSKYIDVGKGVEIQMGISKEKLKAGLNALVESGEYEVHNLRIAQVTDKNNSTPVKVLTKKGLNDAKSIKTWTKFVRLKNLPLMATPVCSNKWSALSRLDGIEFIFVMLFLKGKRVMVLMMTAL